MSKYIYRLETPADFPAVETLTREAFWDVYQPGCDEHYILHIMRGDRDVITELNLVCEMDGEIVGHIFYVRTNVVDENGTAHPVISFGPISVRPDVQHTGIGSEMIRRTFAMAKDMGFGAVTITGNPAYYHRFGFGPAGSHGIVMDDGRDIPELMAVELQPGALNGISGRMIFHPKFMNIDAAEVAEFYKQFPPKEKKHISRR